jgi:multidrug efflux pump subunit AcrA (membrane-fusion protein)
MTPSDLRVMRITLPVVFILSLALAGCGSDESAPQQAIAQHTGPPPALVAVVAVVEKAVRPEIRVIGTIEPKRRTTVSAEVAGLLEQFDLREGDRVVKDSTIIARLKRTDREIALREAQAVLARAQAEWEKLRRGYRQEEVNQRRAEVTERKAMMEQALKDRDRAKELHAEGAISIQQLQREEASYVAARAQYERSLEALREGETGFRPEDVAKAEAEVRQVQAAMERIRDELAKTAVRAPLTGFLVKKHAEAGQWVEEGGKIADLVTLDRVEVVTLIAEREIGRIAVGDQAAFTVDAYPGRIFTGRISHIVPQADLQSRAFPVKIEVDNPPGFPLKGGMLARVAIEYGAPRRTVLVPKDAVLRRGDRDVVFVVNRETAHHREVTTGRAVEGFLEIVRGDLKPGEAIVVTGNEALRDGAPVQVVPAGTAPRPRAHPDGRGEAR